TYCTTLSNISTQLNDITPCFSPPLLPPPPSTLFPYTTLFRSSNVTVRPSTASSACCCLVSALPGSVKMRTKSAFVSGDSSTRIRSEEHTSELQSRENLVCRLLLEKKNTNHEMQYLLLA